MADTCELCMRFHEKYRDAAFSDEMAEDFFSQYERLMRDVLRKKFGIWRRKTAGSIINGLGYGNWKHLWETDEEEKRTDQDIFERVLGEVFYCSDRWTWDRVLRTNWEYLQLKRRVDDRKFWKEFYDAEDEAACAMQEQG